MVAKLILSFFVCLMGACVTHPSDQLYHDLGGESGIASITDELVYRAASDQRVSAHFASTDLDRLAGLIAEQFCALTGGPCTYSGETMADSHRGLGIDNGDFNAIVELLQATMIDSNVPVPVQNRLLARLAPMHQDIVR